MDKIKFISVLIIAVILASCQQEAVVIPTLYQLPTETETPTPTVTTTATYTLVPSLTPSPTLTPTLSRTPTNTPIPTRIPPTATWTLTPIPSATHTPTATATPLPTRTLEPLVISLYQSNVTQAGFGDTVRLRWESNGDSARIEQQNNNGDIIQTFNVDPIGSTQVTLPNEGTIAVYRLVVTRSGEEVRRSISFPLTPPCTDQWFFNPPQDIGCPLAAQSSGQLDYQDFERGFMLRLRSGSLGRVCGIQDNQPNYTCFAITNYTGTPTVLPPGNRFEPGDAFKDVFYNQLAVGGFWYDQIGWGVSPAVTSITTTQTSDRGVLYVQTPEGILGFDQLMNGGQPLIRLEGATITQP